MKRVALVVSLAATLVAGVIVAHAATLNVNAGVLQTQSIVADIDLPVTISVTAYRRAGGSGTVHPHGPVTATLQKDQGYVVSWSGNGPVVPCPSGNDTPLPNGTTEQGLGTYQAQADGTFGFCVDGGGSGLPVISPQDSQGSQAMVIMGEEQTG